MGAGFRTGGAPWIPPFAPVDRLFIVNRVVDIEAPGSLPRWSNADVRLEVIRIPRARGIRHQRNQTGRERAEPALRNRVIGKRFTGGWIENRQSRGAKIALFFSWRRQVHERQIRRIPAVPLHVEVKERPVFSVVQFGNQDRPAYCEAVVVFVIDGRGGVIGAPGVEVIVAENFENISVELVRSRSCLVRYGPLRQSVLSREGRAQHIEFIDLFERGIPDSLKTLGFGLSHRYAVENNLVLEIDAAVDSFAECAARHAWGEEHKRIDLAATAVSGVQLDRQRLNYRVFNGCAEFRLSSVQGNHALLNFQGLRDLARLQTRVHRRHFSDFHADSVVHRQLETRELDLYRISTWNEAGYGVRTRRTGGRVRGDLSCLVRHGDLGIGDDRAGCIRNGSGDSAKRLPVKACRETENQNADRCD